MLSNIKSAIKNLKNKIYEKTKILKNNFNSITISKPLTEPLMK